jgi:small subunit ribosomal protein S9
MAEQYYEGIGRRKESTARVRLMNGSGEFTVNGKTVEEYFPRVGDMDRLMAPLHATKQERSLYNISVLVSGGGVSGQTGAVALGLARALLNLNQEYRPLLRRAELLTRDARVKERKKPGLKRARKAPTYTKR